MSRTLAHALVAHIITTLVSHYHVGGTHTITLGRTLAHWLHTTRWVTHYHLGSHAQFARRRNLLSGSRISHLINLVYLGADKLQKYNCTVSQTNMVIATLLSQRRNILESKHCPNLFDRLSVSVQILSVGAKPGRCQQICTVLLLLYTSSYTTSKYDPVLASSNLSSCLMQHYTQLTNMHSSCCFIQSLKLFDNTISNWQTRSEG